MHFEEICLFNIHVCPLLINAFLTIFNPKELLDSNFVKSHNKNYDFIFNPIWYIAGFNAGCYILFQFLSLRNARDPNDPHTKDIVRTGCWNRFKLALLFICMIVNTIICPIAACVVVINVLGSPQTKLGTNPYTQWMFTFLVLALLPLIAMLNNFNRFGKNCCFLC